MDSERTFTMLIEVSEHTRMRLELVKTIIKVQRRGLAHASWTDAITWLADTVPIPELLADLVNPQPPEAPKET